VKEVNSEKGLAAGNSSYSMPAQAERGMNNYGGKPNHEKKKPERWADDWPKTREKNMRWDWKRSKEKTINRWRGTI